MDFSETFENIKTKATETAQAAAAKAKTLAQIAKANVEILAEQDKQKKGYLELGKLFYRDYVTGEASDEAEYLPWCDKITDSVKKVNQLRDWIDELKAGEDIDDAEVSEESADTFEEVTENIVSDAEDASEIVEDAPETIEADKTEA